MLLQGIGAAPGLALARCLIVQPLPEGTSDSLPISRQQVAAELARFEQAVGSAAAQLAAIREKAERAGDAAAAGIIGAQALMLTDPLLEEGVRDRIANRLFSAVQAVQDTTAEQAAILAGLEDPGLRERSADVRDVGQRILAVLLGVPLTDFSCLESETILVGREITPSQMASLDAAKVRGIVAETGGKTSHTAILANQLEIAAVLGCPGILSSVRDGELILVDGEQGTVETEIAAGRYGELQQEILRQRHLHESLSILAGEPAQTLDGVTVTLAANVMDPAGAVRAEKLGADGIGLFRTEFLFLDRPSAPTEEEQYEAYATVARAMNGKPVIIRTLDIGGDKEIPYLNLPRETNPFLGCRGIRICLRDKPLFLTQLRAILRAGVHGRVRVMYPMIAALEELRQANRVLAEAKDSLRAEGAAFDETLAAGIMVETPSAAVMADLLIQEAAFFSIGSNDLTQYTLAVDRLNGRIGELYSPYQPAVLRLIRSVTETANRAGGGKFAGLCGEMASDPRATLLLLGLGLTEFSVNPAALLKIKKIIRGVRLSDAREVADQALHLATAAQVEAFLTAALPAGLC